MKSNTIMGAMKNQKQDGFTITELIIVIVAFAILLPAIAGMVGSLDRLNSRARNAVVLHGLVENKVESLRSAGFTSLTNGTTTFTSEMPASVATPRSASYTVTTPSAALKQVTVDVSYNDGGTTRTLTYRTYIGDSGVGQ